MYDYKTHTANCDITNITCAIWLYCGLCMQITRIRRMDSLSKIKNKLKRSELYRREKALRNKEKRRERTKKRKEAESSGETVGCWLACSGSSGVCHLPSSAGPQASSEDAGEHSRARPYHSRGTWHRGVCACLSTDTLRTPCREMCSFATEGLSYLLYVLVALLWSRSLSHAVWGPFALFDSVSSSLCILFLVQVLEDEATDEMAPYFSRITTPKVVILGESRPCNVRDAQCTNQLLARGSSTLWLTVLLSLCLIHIHCVRVHRGLICSCVSCVYAYPTLKCETGEMLTWRRLSQRPLSMATLTWWLSMRTTKNQVSVIPNGCMFYET